MFLQIFGAPGMIAVAVTHDDVFDHRGIKIKFLQPVYDFVFNRIIVDSIDEDNSFGCSNGPRRIFRLSHPIKVVEDFHRFGVPGFSSRILFCYSPDRYRGGKNGRRGRSAESVEQTFMFLAGGELGSFNPGFCRISARLSHRTCRCEEQKDELPVHGNSNPEIRRISQRAGILRYFELSVLRDHFF
jgi:hypothetical protein